jgi:hypothetical protein
MESDLAQASTLTLTGSPAEVVDQINARFNPRCRLGELALRLAQSTAFSWHAKWLPRQPGIESIGRYLRAFTWKTTKH